MADWMPPSPSQQTLFSSMLGDNIGSITVSESTNECESGFSFHDYTDEPQPHSAIDQTTRSCGPSKQNMSSHGGLLERMAARAGFNAPRLNTQTFRSDDLSQNRDVLRSPYFTIPPGFSPTALLESPVFVSNSLAQPSPTTGKFSYVPPSGATQSSGLFTDFSDRTNENIFGCLDSSSFDFRHAPSHFFGSSERESFQFPSIEVSVQSENKIPPQNLENQQDDLCNMSEQRTTTTGSVVLEFSSPLDEQDDEADQRGGGNEINGVESPAEDGYNWRKYGQKQVKGSDFPRSYYKCTDMNCHVKKKIERSIQGQITEIIYKGVHNHPIPPPHRKSPASFGDSDPVWGGNMASDVTSSTMIGSQYCNGTKLLGDVADGSSTFSNNEDDDERGTHGSASVVDDGGGGDESESKKRKVDAYVADMSGVSRGMREPRVVVQTTSEVDILDDGYRWRKYGQKVVKGNPNPRSYYKCTSVGCSVRKHVERASHDLKSVITTYEGKHNHDVPAARNSGSNVATGVQSQVLKPEPSQLRNNMSQFDRSNNASFGSFGLPNRPLLVPPQNFGYAMSQRNMPNMALLGGWGGPNHNQGDGLGLPFHQGHQYPRQQQQAQRAVNETLPKGESKVEPMSETGFSLPNASSIYQQVMNRMPLGPHM